VKVSFLIEENNMLTRIKETMVLKQMGLAQQNVQDLRSRFDRRWTFIGGQALFI